MESTWNTGAFRSDLNAELSQIFSGMNVKMALGRGVEACASAGEGACAGRSMDCGPGCPHCCVLNVATLLPEAMVIADHLRSTYAPDELASMREGLVVHRTWGRWMTDEERIVERVVCPFLNGTGSCSIHPVRPLSCRGVASLDSTTCRQAFDPAEDGQSRTVPTDLIRRAAYDEAFRALARILGQHGLDERSIELCTGVLVFLDHPEYGEALLGGDRLPRELWG